MDECCYLFRVDSLSRVLYFNCLYSRKEQSFHPNPSNPREITSKEPNPCAVVTPEEMLVIKGVKERISWTWSDSELAKRQQSDSLIKIINLALERYGVNLKDSHCTFGTNPISKEEA